jgi:predicted DNA-binding protein with PD1-like motif
LQTLPLRLPPGCDPRQEIERAVGAIPQRSGFVLSGTGSLTQASLRFAAADVVTARVEALEIVSLSGSVTPDAAHLHAVGSTASGSVLGGRVAYGCLVRTTAEIPIASSPEWKRSRAHDPASGDKELKIERPQGDVA